ncbi:AAA family ATPase [Thermococcus aggregans]|uniref:AAA family ATPase n=1 Tax=Thermococcus aggregans TaxID=110163 RepID=A0A9E7MX28_THEAG|nr:AAA family ATPase [Thermococcus aggregans]USS40453.1 AAA family ATPase [Thermococcus aggregans]
MLTKMLIENYKSIKKAELEFSKINVLVGPNGSGKTSILECAEVLRNPHVYTGSITNTVGIESVLENLFEIKFFDEIVHAHDISKTIHINADFKDVGILRVEVSLSKEKGTRKLIGNQSSNRDLKMELSRILHILKTNRRVGRRLGEC